MIVARGVGAIAAASFRSLLGIAGLLVLVYQAIVLVLHLNCVNFLVRAAPGLITTVVAALLMLYGASQLRTSSVYNVGQFSAGLAAGLHFLPATSALVAFAVLALAIADGPRSSMGRLVGSVVLAVGFGAGSPLLRVLSAVAGPIARC